MPGPLSPRSVPAHRSSRESFDLLVGDVLASLDHHFAAEPDQVDIIVEEAPLLPPEWTDEVPLSIVVSRPQEARLVLFRLPISHRCSSRRELEDVVWSVVLERLAEVWHMSPDDLDPR